MGITFIHTPKRKNTAPLFLLSSLAWLSCLPASYYCVFSTSTKVLLLSLSPLSPYYIKTASIYNRKYLPGRIREGDRDDRPLLYMRSLGALLGQNTWSMYSIRLYLNK